MSSLAEDLEKVRQALEGVLSRLGPNGYIPSCGEPATTSARKALAMMPSLIERVRGLEAQAERSRVPDFQAVVAAESRVPPRMLKGEMPAGSTVNAEDVAAFEGSFQCTDRATNQGGSMTITKEDRERLQNFEHCRCPHCHGSIVEIALRAVAAYDEARAGLQALDQEFNRVIAARDELAKEKAVSVEDAARVLYEAHAHQPMPRWEFLSQGSKGYWREKIIALAFYGFMKTKEDVCS